MSRKFMETPTREIDEDFNKLPHAFEEMVGAFDEAMILKEEGALTVPNLKHLKKRLQDLEHTIGAFRQEYGI